MVAFTAEADLVTGWCLFGFALLVILVFCWVYVRKYQSRQESEVISTITSIFALAIALITSALLPVDIFLVSYVKNQNGTFKDWADANVTRQIEDTVLYAYYTFASHLKPRLLDKSYIRNTINYQLFTPSYYSVYFYGSRLSTSTMKRKMKMMAVHVRRLKLQSSIQ